MTQDSSFYLSHLLKQNLSKKISQQIQREFEKINTPIDAILNLNDYEKTVNIITEKIKALEKTTPNKLVEMMYHSDIAEGKVISALQKGKDYHQTLANLLILRSAKKVYYQIKYTTKRAENDNF